MTQLNLINLKNIFLYEIWLIAIREVSPPFDEEQQHWRPYRPKHSPCYYYLGCLGTPKNQGQTFVQHTVYNVSTKKCSKPDEMCQFDRYARMERNIAI